MSALLSQEQIDEALDGLPEWRQDGAALVRTIDFPSFPAAIRAVDRIAEIAERADHHPDMDIRWRTVKFACSTHSEGGVTGKDVDLAKEIDTVAAEIATNT